MIHVFRRGRPRLLQRLFTCGDLGAKFGRHAVAVRDGVVQLSLRVREKVGRRTCFGPGAGHARDVVLGAGRRRVVLTARDDEGLVALVAGVVHRGVECGACLPGAVELGRSNRRTTRRRRVHQRRRRRQWLRRHARRCRTSRASGRWRSHGSQRRPTDRRRASAARRRPSACASLPRRREWIRARPVPHRAVPQRRRSHAWTVRGAHPAHAILHRRATSAIQQFCW